MQPFDYGAAIRNAQGILPDMRAFGLQERQLALQEQQARAAEQQFREKLAAEQYKRQRQEAFSSAFSSAVQSRDPNAIKGVIAQFPEYSEDSKRVIESMDVPDRRANMRVIGQALSAAENGNPALAAQVLKGRLEADKAAGQGDPTTEQIVKLLEAGDPESIEKARGMMTYGLALASGDDFDQVYRALNPVEAKTNVQREYAWRVSQFGQEAADKWLATQDARFVSVDAGGQVYQVGAGGIVSPGSASVPATAKGGDPASGGGGGRYAGPPPSEFTFGRPTSGKRTPEGNRRVGGVPNSAHLRGDGMDFVPAQGQSIAQLAQQAREYFGPTARVINEGDHVHVEMPGYGKVPYLGKNGTAGARQGSEPVKVKTRQQFERLPSGTVFIAPDGTRRVKP